MALETATTEYDVFIKDLSTGEISLVSQTEGGIQPNVNARLTGLTADGSAVSFTSYADNIDVAGHDGMSAFVTPTAIEFRPDLPGGLSVYNQELWFTNLALEKSVRIDTSDYQSVLHTTWEGTFWILLPLRW